MMMKRAALLLVVMAIAIAAVITARVATADNPTVTILSAPIKMNETIILDLNGDGVHTPDEVAGVFNVYDGHREIVFTWVPDAYQAAHLDTMSYRISLVQFSMPFTGTGGPSTQYRTSHHWAANPNGLVFSMDSFQSEPLCYGCPSMIVVVPEIITKYLNTATGVWEYAYEQVPEYATSPLALTGQQQSGLFVLENTPLNGNIPASGPGGVDTGSPCSATLCGDAVCDAICGEQVVGSFYYCPSDCP
jgi:hypothetical protein